MTAPKTIKINEVEYVRSDSVPTEAKKLGDYPYRIVRTRSAGVFAGYVKSLEGQTVEMVEARRIWYWKGANSLSQLAMDGTNTPSECKFPEAVTVTLFEVIEILTVTDKAQKSIQGVKVWKA